MAVELTHKQAVNREKDIQDELERLKAKTDKTPEDHAAVSPLLVEFREVHAHRLDLEHDAALAEVRAAGGTPRVEKDADDTRGQAGDVDLVDKTRAGAPMLGGKYRNPWDTSEMRYGNDPRSELRARALDAIEAMPYATDKVREASAKLVENDGENSRLARMVLASSSPEYTKAFTKLIRSQGQAAILDPAESHALSRAMSLTDSAGGYLVPFQLDPTVILTANGSVNEVRKIARVVQATGDVWNGVSSAGVTGSWDAEAAQVSDDAPTLAQPTIPVYKGAVFVPISVEAQADAANVANEVASMIAFEKDRMESVAFVTGSGSGEPTGIITALLAASPSVTVNSATTDTFAIADVFALDSALPARYAANGSWLAHRAIYNLVRRFDTNGGAGLWGYLAESRQSELLGRPAYVAEAMDGAITALAANPSLVFGDFSNYVIADRVGTTMSYIPHLFGANGRPTGSSGWYAYFRTGADSVNDGAFRLLDIT
jgi:HK97 family phage major capsid protein